MPVSFSYCCFFFFFVREPYRVVATSQQEEAGVVLGRSIGPFVLGQTLQTAVDVIRHHLPKHKAEVRYHEGEPSRHLLLLNACERDGASGFYVLRFDATLQLLIAVSYFPPLRVRLANTTSAGVGGGPSLPSTIGDLIDSFRQPGRWEATTLAGRKEEAVRCFYEGTCFVFRCVHGGGSREFKLDKGAAVSKSELIALHVTTHAGAPTYCLWGGVVSLSKLMPTHFGLLESRFVVEAVTRCARGIEMGAKSGDIIQVLFGATSQDVLRALGCPDNVWHKEDRHVSVDGHPIQRAGTVGVYFSYTRLGVSFLIDAKAHQVKKIVMHTNVPGYFEFCSYSRCNFKVSLTIGGLATDGEDSFLLMPETKWSTLVRNVDAACIRHLRRCLYKPSTNSYYPFLPTNLWVLFDQFLVETTSHDDIAKVTIVAPDWTTVTTRQLVVTRTSGNLLPVRDEVVPSGNGLGHLVGNVPGVHQLGHDDNSATGHAPASNDWRRSNERHTGVCCVEAHSSMSNDDDDELFCSAESSLEALRLSPASPASQDISHFCPSLNTLLAEVQREEAVVLPHYNSVVYNSVVYDFLDGPRVGVADDGAPRDAPPPLVISLSNMDSESGSMEGDGNDDALKTLQDEHTVVGVEDRAKDGLSPEDSLFEIVSHKELDEVPAPSRRTVAGTSLAGPDEHILSEGHTPMEGHALSGSHTSNEQLEARSTESKTPSPKREDHLQILYRPSISAATPSRLLSLSQDLGVVTRAREKGRQVGTAKMASTSTHASSHTSTQSEKAWGRLLGHTQSSERRVRQKYQPRTGEREGEELECAGGREVCEGAVCEDTGPENGTRPCLEGGGGEGVDQVSEARHQEAAQSEPHPPGSSGDLGMSCAARECQVVTDDMGCLRAGSIPQAAVLEGCLTREQLDTTQGMCALHSMCILVCY